MSDQTYDSARERNLEEMLRSLARRILELDEGGRLLPHTGELTKLIGDVRSELFHYEVRVTYDTPEVAESRRIVAEAQNGEEDSWHRSDWMPGGEQEQEEDE